MKNKSHNSSPSSQALSSQPLALSTYEALSSEPSRGEHLNLPIPKTDMIYGSILTDPAGTGKVSPQLLALSP